MHTDHSRPASSDDRKDPAYAPRRVPLSGDVSPDGTRPWPRANRKERLLVWGGVAATAAVATVGMLLAVRTVVERITGDTPDEAAKRPLQPQPLRHRAAPPADAMPKPTPAAPAARHGTGSDAFSGRFSGPRPPSGTSGIKRSRPAAAPFTARPRPAQPPRSATRRSRSADAHATLAEMSAGVGALLANVTAAMDGFRKAAGQAGYIAEEFHDTADKVRDMLDRGLARRAQQRAASAEDAGAAPEARPHMPGDDRDGPTDPAPPRGDDRQHRL